jgi:hypothetical protein
MPFREKARKVCLLSKVGHFLRSSLRDKSAELRPFLAIFRGIQPNFSASQTAWRSKRDSNSQYLFEPLSADVSVSCRLQNTAREFHAKT